MTIGINGCTVIIHVRNNHVCCGKRGPQIEENFCIAKKLYEFQDWTALSTYPMLCRTFTPLISGPWTAVRVDNSCDLVINIAYSPKHIANKQLLGEMMFAGLQMHNFNEHHLSDGYFPIGILDLYNTITYMCVVSRLAYGGFAGLLTKESSWNSHIKKHQITNISRIVCSWNFLCCYIPISGHVV